MSDQRPPFTACKLGLVALQCPDGQSSKSIRLMGVGRGFSVSRMVICTRDWGESFLCGILHVKLNVIEVTQ